MSNDDGATKIEVASILGYKTKAGLVELTVNDLRIQMQLTKAREIVGMLQGAIEAAISDELMFKFLTTKVGLDEPKAAAALLDFRQLRQGSRETVWLEDVQ